jgi:hypothetical protein
MNKSAVYFNFIKVKYQRVMKTNIVFYTVLILSISLIYSCKKDKKDTTPPVITISGTNPITDHCLNAGYNDPGATAYDETDGDITSRIIVTKNVDTLHVGNYQVKYNVTDKAGNAAIEAIRNVTVIICK